MYKNALKRLLAEIHRVKQATRGSIAFFQSICDEEVQSEADRDMLLHKLEKTEELVESACTTCRVALEKSVKSSNTKANEHMDWEQYTTHERRTLFVCEICDVQMTFRTRTLYADHIANAHPRLGCNNCLRFFSHPADLERHKEQVCQSTLKVLWPCRECTFAATHQANLFRHIAVRHELSSSASVPPDKQKSSRASRKNFGKGWSKYSEEDKNTLLRIIKEADGGKWNDLVWKNRGTSGERYL